MLNHHHHFHFQHMHKHAASCINIQIQATAIHVSTKVPALPHAIHSFTPGAPSACLTGIISKVHTHTHTRATACAPACVRVVRVVAGRRAGRPVAVPWAAYKHAWHAAGMKLKVFQGSEGVETEEHDSNTHKSLGQSLTTGRSRDHRLLLHACAV